MNLPRIIISVPAEILEKVNRIAERRTLSRSALVRTLLVEKLESITLDEPTKNKGVMPYEQHNR